MVRAHRLLTEFGIKVPETLEDAEIDPDGQLILELRTARVSLRSHSRTRKNRPQINTDDADRKAER